MIVPHWRGLWNWRGIGKAQQLQMELKEYMNQLTTIHKVIYSQEQNRTPETEVEPENPIMPTDKVYLRVFRRK